MLFIIYDTVSFNGRCADNADKHVYDYVYKSGELIAEQFRTSKITT